MIFLQHDFFENYTGGVKSGDTDLVGSLVVNEISDLIVYEPEKVVDLLNKIGHKTTKAASDEAIVDKIVNNLVGNEKLRKGLAFLIAENNKVVKAEDKGNDKKQESWRRTIDKITEGVSLIARDIEDKPQNKGEIKQKMMAAIATKSEAVGDRERKHTKSKNGKYVLLLLVVIGAGVGIYFYMKHRKKVAAEGAIVDGTAATAATAADAATAA